MNYFSIFLLILTFPSISFSQPVEFIYCHGDKENFPYHMGNKRTPSTQNLGIDIELLKMIEKRLPIKVKFKSLPWKRCQMELRDGGVSAIIGSYKKNREEIGVYPKFQDGRLEQNKSIYSGNYSMFVLKDSAVLFDHGTEQFTNTAMPIGVNTGYSIVDQLISAGNTIEKNSAGTFAIFHQLVTERISAAVVLEEQGVYLLGKFSFEFENIERKSVPVKSKPAFIIISHQFYEKHPELSEKIWNFSSELRVRRLNGLYKKYYDQMEVDDFK